MTETLAKPAPKPWIMGISPYVPGKAASDSGKPLIKLSANENPLGTSPAGRAAAEGALADLATYPDPGATKLREAIAARYGLDPARIIYGIGSDELLHLAAGTYAGQGDEVIYPRYGFSVYDIAARRVGAVPVIAPDRDYGTDVDNILAAVTDRTRLVYIANPNNPTGTFIPRAEVERLHAGLRPDIVLVIDQAYAEYLAPEEDDGGLDLARGQDNVFICRTFSKIYGLAAERIGWGYGASEMIWAMHRIRAPFNLTTSGQAAAAAAIGDVDWIEKSRAHNEKWRAWLTEQMSALGNHGLSVIPSKANFILILFRGEVRAETVYRALMDAGYATRWLPNQELPDALRITIGSEEQMRDIARIVRQVVGEAN